MPMTNGQIVNAVRESVEEARMEVDALGFGSNEGTQNFDCIVIALARPRPTLAAALNAAGFKVDWRSFRLQGRGYTIHDGALLPGYGYAQAWTSFCDRVAAKLNARGVPAHVRYMMD